MMPWLLRALLFGVLMSVGALMLERALRATRLPLRAVWCVALLLSVFVPLFALLQPQLWPDSIRPVLTVASSTAADVDTLANTASGITQSPLVIAWLVIVLFGVTRYVHGWIALWRARRLWSRAQCCGEAVLVAADVGPALVGLLQPTIVVPAWLLRSDTRRQRMALLHEQEHARAHDQWLLALAPLLAIAFPWNITLWWQLRRLRLAIELDCDRRVLSRGVESAAYGTMLLDIAAGTYIPRAAALAEPRSLLSHRIAALARQAEHPAVRIACAGATALVLLLGAAVTAPALIRVAPIAGASISDAVIPQPGALSTPAAEMPQRVTVRMHETPIGTDAPVARVVRTPLPEPVRVHAQPLRTRVQVRAPETISPKPLFVVDGRIITDEASEELMRRQSDEIESIEVIKGVIAERLFGARASNGVISITTKNRRGR
jgi:beta-lactamase regulating signal transducer with metallopeptidase domain